MAHVLQITHGAIHHLCAHISSLLYAECVGVYSPVQLLPQTMKSCRDDSHLTNPGTLRKIQIKEGRKDRSDLLASSVCAGCTLVKNPSMDPVTERIGLYVLSSGLQW